MADVKVNTPGYYSTSANDRLIYQGGNGYTAQLFTFQTEPADSWDGAITVQRRVHDDHPTRTPGTFAPVPYQKLVEAGSVSDGAYHTDTITGTSGVSEFTVDATGADIALSIASRTTGSVVVRCKKQRG